MSGLVEIQLLNGIVQGMIYALVAAGLTLIFGMLDIPNFAHGAFYALGAYVAFTVDLGDRKFLARDRRSCPSWSRSSASPSTRSRCGGSRAPGTSTRSCSRWGSCSSCKRRSC